MNGRRIYPDANGWLNNPEETPGGLKAGDYGHATNPDVIGHVTGWWQLCCPDGSQGSLNPSVHTVVEHEDGTITVSPSIVTATWHGFLERGVWRSV